MKGRNSTVAICALIVMALATAAHIQRKKSLPPIRFWVGFGVAFTGFSILTDLRSPMGPALAVLTTTSATIYYGDDAIKLFGARIGKDPTPPGDAAAAAGGIGAAIAGQGANRTGDSANQSATGILQQGASTVLAPVVNALKATPLF